MIAALDLRQAARAVRVELPNLPALYGAAQATWRGRMINEYRSSAVFEALAEQMKAAGFDEARVEECRGFADEERRHGILCGAVLEACGGQAVSNIEPDGEFPLHEDVSPREGVLRNLLSISCMSETVAVALIGAERLEMPEGALRDLLSQIWADEIGHARFGWAIVNEEVPKLSPKAKERLADYLCVAFAHVEEHELAHLPTSSTPPPEGAALGLCRGADARVLFLDTITEVIIPRLEALGLHAREAWEQRRAA